MDEIAAFHRPYLGLPIPADQSEPAREKGQDPLVKEDVALLRFEDARTHGTGNYLPAFAKAVPVGGVINKDPFESVRKELPPAVGSAVGSEHERVCHHGGKAVTAKYRVALIHTEFRIKQGFKCQILHINIIFSRSADRRTGGRTSFGHEVQPEELLHRVHVFGAQFVRGKGAFHPQPHGFYHEHVAGVERG